MLMFLLNHYKILVFLGCFVLFRLMIQSDEHSDPIASLCEKKTKEPHPFVAPVNFSAIGCGEGGRVLELYEPGVTSFLHPKSSDDSTTKKLCLLFVMFYSPNCPYCIDARKEFATGGEMLFKEGDHEVQFAVVNCLQNRQTCRDEKIDGYPTFFLYKEGLVLEEYTKQRTAPKFVAYLKLKKRSGWRSWIPFT